MTGATSTSAGNNTVLSGFTDTSGYEGTLAGSFTQLATAPTGDDFKGLAFAPATALPNNGDTPEVPLALVLPLAGGAVLAGGVFWTSPRRRTALGPGRRPVARRIKSGHGSAPLARPARSRKSIPESTSGWGQTAMHLVGILL